MKTAKTILFSGAILLPIIGFINLITNYFYNIELLYLTFFWYWLILFIVNLFIVFGSKTKFFSSLFFGLAFITLSIYQLLSFDFYIRKPIDGAHYQVEGYRDHYKVVERYFLLEKTISEKPSEIFSTNNTKTGVVFWFEVKLLAETEHELVLEIISNMGKQHDTLVKRKFWE
ncbi:hypothetical protein EZJ43_07970 [Pedobacter changchengzhani]|uniref:Uncharacterized protein n=1 Tax=Pedobacter changchengzhani TaxID=2529274 RepID=A0A4R5MMD9_9SPHI|nr:hypothetical protein [Pedobacter changchengzhani]TDG36445.1 hypothetical protein EZJ43_07970 [Pedobacter changchengzhani]